MLQWRVRGTCPPSGTPTTPDAYHPTHSPTHPLLASVQVGDAAFANRFNELVNHRDLNFAEDLIGDVPCAPAMPACPATPSGLLGSVSRRVATLLAEGGGGGVLSCLHWLGCAWVLPSTTYQHTPTHQTSCSHCSWESRAWRRTRATPRNPTPTRPLAAGSRSTHRTCRKQAAALGRFLGGGWQAWVAGWCADTGRSLSSAAARTALIPSCIPIVAWHRTMPPGSRSTACRCAGRPSTCRLRTCAGALL